MIDPQILRAYLGVAALFLIVFHTACLAPPRETDAAADAFRERRSHVRVSGAGVVTRLMSDDNDGSRHQRFVLRTDLGQTILIQHNIDVAPRIDGIRIGDRITFTGQYIWNDQGGLIHWTHHDPAGSHPGGWIEWDGKRYE